MRSLVFPFVSGGLFGTGLLVAGMTRPERVTGFLDVFGTWNPTLAFVMVGAIGIHALALRLVLRKESPLFGEKFHLPTRKDVDVKLVLGSAIFGLGWGLGGYCPGPGLVSAAGLSLPAVVFVLAMLVGMTIEHHTSKVGVKPHNELNQGEPSS